MAVTTECPVCRCVSANSLLHFEDYDVYKCVACGHAWVFPNLRDEELLHGYAVGEVEIPSSSNERMNHWFLGEIEKLERRGILLDIGAWFGEFLRTAISRGWKVAAVEPNQTAQSHLSRHLGIDTVSNTVHDLIRQNSTFKTRVVTAFHVIEHVTDGHDFLRGIGAILEGGGLLAIRTPNVEALLFRIFGRHWGHLAVPVHVNLYSPRSISLLLENSGFQPIRRITISSPAVNEVFEMAKCLVKMTGVVESLRARRSIQPRREQAARRNVGVFPKQKALFEFLTKPLYFLSYPIWALANSLGAGSELFVIARKIELGEKSA